MKAEGGGRAVIRAEGDIVNARIIVRDVSQAMGFGVTDVTRIVTAASELARNIFRYAGTGVMYWRTVHAGAREGIELRFEDSGPGIPDVAQAMEMGYTTGGGLGQGLPGVKRLMHEMRINSQAGKGTHVTVTRWLSK
jgi:serine/threonine-protein kinase RsbT